MNIFPSRTGILISILIALVLLCEALYCYTEKRDRFVVVGYFHGDTVQLSRYPLQKLTHLCYSFLHLKGNRLSINSTKDSLEILYLTSLKKQYPDLKILLSLGGWGGCKTCSEVFSSGSGRADFAKSTLELLQQYGADGIDLDWEYPSVEGFPGHRYTPDDRHNFTLLVQKLRHTLGNNYEITFAAGATTACLSESIEWNEVMPYVDRVHLMTYDLTNGFSKVTGHHTPLYSTKDQPESSDHAVRYLDSLGVPDNKIVLGLAFYARAWSNVDENNNGLYRPGTFVRYIGFKDFGNFFGKDGAFAYHWDSTAQAPYRYSREEHLYATFDDRRSVALKVDYALEHHLGGIMFWELTEDTSHDGLLDAIDKELKKTKAPIGGKEAR